MLALCCIYIKVQVNRTNSQRIMSAFRGPHLNHVGLWLCLRAPWLDNYDRKVPTSTGERISLTADATLVGVRFAVLSDL
jgi:hypothetical protein